MSNSKRTRREKNLRKRNTMNARAHWSNRWSQPGPRQPQVGVMGEGEAVAPKKAAERAAGAGQGGA